MEVEIGNWWNGKKILTPPPKINYVRRNTRTGKIIDEDRWKEKGDIFRREPRKKKKSFERGSFTF